MFRNSDTKSSDEPFDSLYVPSLQRLSILYKCITGLQTCVFVPDERTYAFGAVVEKVFCLEDY